MDRSVLRRQRAALIGCCCTTDKTNFQFGVSGPLVLEERKVVVDDVAEMEIEWTKIAQANLRAERCLSRVTAQVLLTEKVVT